MKINKFVFLSIPLFVKLRGNKWGISPKSAVFYSFFALEIRAEYIKKSIKIISV